VQRKVYKNYAKVKHKDEKSETETEQKPLCKRKKTKMTQKERSP